MKYGIQYFVLLTPNLDWTQITAVGFARELNSGQSRFTSGDAVRRLRLLGDVPKKYLLSATLHTLQPIPKFVRPTIRFSLWLDLHDAQNGPFGAPNGDYFPWEVEGPPSRLCTEWQSKKSGMYNFDLAELEGFAIWAQRHEWFLRK